jgi:hypothetical protein
MHDKSIDVLFAPAQRAAMSKGWFQTFIDEAVIAEGGNESRLAERLGMKGTSQINRWRNGMEPKLGAAVEVIEALGGDIRRALPGWQPETAQPLAEGMIIGRVAAGTARYSESDSTPVQFSPAPFLRSRWSPYTRTPQSGRRVEWIQVDGDSMEPDYLHGSLIACRPPRDPRELVDGVHAIIRNAAGDMTFKALHFRGTGRNREVVAVPLNRSHGLQFFPAAEVEIDWICLGMLDIRVDRSAAGVPLLAETGEIPPLPEVVTGDGSDIEP